MPEDLKLLRSPPGFSSSGCAAMNVFHAELRERADSIGSRLLGSGRGSAIEAFVVRHFPLFIAVWAGSAVALVFATVLTVFNDIGPHSALINSLLIAACFSYLLGVQHLTFVVHIPLNNKIQQINAELSDGLELAKHRIAFEPRWNRWNVLRTVIGAGASVLLLIGLTLD